MATKKKSSTKRSSSGSDPKSKRIVRKKVGETMHEFKHHELESGSGRKVKNPKQAIAIGLSEARRSGANIPPSPNQKRSRSKRSGGATKKAASKRAPAKKSASKRSPAKKTASKRSATKKTASRRRS
ncbi:MAG: DUF6496 domain-containing protein [Bryobacteraceae bacterium]